MLAGHDEGTAAYDADYSALAKDLRALGLRPSCALNGGPYLPVAYYLGCATNLVSKPDPGQRVALLTQTGQPPPSFAGHWKAYPLPGTKSISYVARMPLAPHGSRSRPA